MDEIDRPTDKTKNTHGFFVPRFEVHVRNETEDTRGFYAVFVPRFEVHVKIDADNWQDAAKIAISMETPKADTVFGEVAFMSEDGAEVYDVTHEVVGPCNKCGFFILDGCRKKDCTVEHGGPGGWVSTECGRVIWCCQTCRDADRKNDPEWRGHDE